MNSDYDYECLYCKATVGCHLALLPNREAFLEHIVACHPKILASAPIGAFSDLRRFRYDWNSR